MSSSVPLAVAPLLTTLWPLLILVLAVSGVTALALLLADKRDIPVIFASFAQAFGIHNSAGHSTESADRLEERDDTEQMAPPAEVEQSSEEA